MTDPAPLGLLMLKTRFPRIEGDLGNPATWPFPVRLRVVEAASARRVIHRRGEGLLEDFIAEGRALAQAGCAGLATSCGFLSLFQDALADALPVPVLASSLMQVPLIDAILPGGRRAGVLTIAASALGPDHLAAAGLAPDTPVGTTEGGRELSRVILGDETRLDVAAARQDMIDAARALQASHPGLGAIVLECTNMGPYAADVARATGLPCYSIVTALRWFHAGLVPPRFAPA